MADYRGLLLGARAATKMAGLWLAMADISMCSGRGCNQADNCYRFTAPVNPYWQAYGQFTPDERGQCEMFWDNKEYKCKTVTIHQSTSTGQKN